MDRFQPTATRRAFTLIELLIVIGIIGLLIAIGLMLGKHVVDSGKERLTLDILRVLDSSLVDYEAAKGEMPGGTLVIKDGSDKYEYPILDGREDLSGNYDRVNNPAAPSVARYTALIALGTSQQTLSGIDSKHVRPVQVETDASASTAVQAVRGQEVLDGWMRPIRAVHPKYDGGYGGYYENGSIKARQDVKVVWGKNGTKTTDFRRSYRPFDPKSTGGQPVGDADEGLCASGRMYFYSAGPDGDPGTREDNVYGSVPQYPKETASLK